MFELQILYGEIKLEDAFREKVKKWLDNNPEYLKQAYKQVLFVIKYILLRLDHEFKKKSNRKLSNCTINIIMTK